MTKVRVPQANGIIAFLPAPIKTFDASLRFPAESRIGNPGVWLFYVSLVRGVLGGRGGFDIAVNSPAPGVPTLALVSLTLPGDRVRRIVLPEERHADRRQCSQAPAGRRA